MDRDRARARRRRSSRSGGRSLLQHRYLAGRARAPTRCTCCRPSSAEGDELRPNPDAERLDRRVGPASARPAERARGACGPRAGSRSSSSSTAHDAARDRVRVQPRGLRPGRRAVPCRWRAADDRGRAGGRSARIAEAHTAGLDDDELAVLGYAAWLAGLQAGLAAHHAGHGAADEGSRGGGVRGGAREGRVRDRDAGARHQHAGAVGGDREAHEVHRGAPRVPDAGGVHAADADGPAAAASTTSGTRSCSGARG